MTLYTNTINRKMEDAHGIRISVMRFNRFYYDYDAWFRSLAPSKDLLLGYKEGRITWREYVRIYRKEVLEKQKVVLKGLTDMALRSDVTLLCWESSPEKCHRRLIAEECKKYDTELITVIE